MDSKTDQQACTCQLCKPGSYTIQNGMFQVEMQPPDFELEWLRQKAAIEDESLISVGGLVSQL